MESTAPKKTKTARTIMIRLFFILNKIKLIQIKKQQLFL